MIFRFRWQVLGAHTHVRVFAGRSDGGLGKCGELTFRNEEFRLFREATEMVEVETVVDSTVSRCTIEFLPEGISIS